MKLGMQGKVALVTGGARDVGREIAMALAAEGAAVAVNFNSSEEEAALVVGEIRAHGGRAAAFRADVTDYGQVRSMVADVVHDLGGLDILVNNAGFVMRQRFLDTTEEDWRRQIDVGLYGVIHCCHAAGEHLAARGGGRIVSLCGDSARVGESGLAITAASRGGVIALTKSLAREFGRAGVTVNALALGLVETSHTDSEWLESNRDKITRLYPLRRLGQPSDIAPMVAFLASEHASWITGQILSVNGGFSMVG
jgi:3-oxoacyl-[acyl-carrier protein] reductase